MKNISRQCRLSAYLIVVSFVNACASVPHAAIDISDSHAFELLQAAANAQGIGPLQQLQDVRFQYEGKWGADIVAKVQPVLVDKRFRGNSREQYDLVNQTTEQTCTGEAGTKRVLRTQGKIQVWYNGKEENDPEKLDAAALVADGYRMFLLGPAFFVERHAIVQYLGSETIDGRDCDNLLAVLRPGIGRSAEDRVIVSIDKQRHFIRRFRMTVEGMSSTKGAVADVFPHNLIRIGGIVWPTMFDEELKRPFPVHVHHWEVTQIDLDQNPQTGSLK